MQQSAVGPVPPARDAPAAARIRRSSVPTVSYRNVLEAAAALKSDDSDTSRAPPPVSSSLATDVPVARRPSARKQPQHEASRHGLAARGMNASGPAATKVTRQGSLFASQEKKRERTEQSEVIAALQQNGAALSVLNEREKARSELLRAQVEQLQTELDKVKEALDEEKTKNEKITALRQHKGSSDYSGNYLPDIHGSSSSAAAAAALQQQAQLEISYQRRILSLENRSKDLIENNKKLLAKIQQLEKTEADAGAEIDALRQENTRLATQTDSLSNTVASQSSLIIGLRTTVQRLTTEEQTVSSLAKKLERCQLDLDAVRTRETFLRDEHERLKVVLSKDKEMLMDKVLELQKRLQISEQAGDTAEAFMNTIRALEADKLALETRVSALTQQCELADARMHQQEEMTNRFLLEKQSGERECEQLQAALAAKVDELVAQQALIDSLRLQSARGQELDEIVRKTQEQCDHALRARESEVDALMRQLVDQARVVDDLQSALGAKDTEIQRLRSDVQRFQQLSQDETVQALQLARMKAANHEALSLLEDEKRALQERIDALQLQLERETQRFDTIRAALEASLDARDARVQDLLEETRALHERASEAPTPTVVEVEKVVEAPLSSVDPEERARLEAEMVRLQCDFDELRQSFEYVEAEYKKLVTKKYKTESFQSQVRLLQNENSELSGRLELACADLARERADLTARTRENLDLKARVLDPSAVELLRKTQESLEKTVSALVEAEAASESSFTCLQCMRLFVEPMTLAPCGHTYCTSCLASFGDVDDPSSLTCKDCSTTHNTPASSAAPDAVFPNHALADLTARFLFRQQSLSSLTTMCLSLRNSFANRSTS